MRRNEAELLFEGDKDNHQSSPPWICNTRTFTQRQRQRDKDNDQSFFHRMQHTHIHTLPQRIGLFDRGVTMFQVFIDDHDGHDICQNFYATSVLGARILRKKRVNRDITQFATKEHKCFEMA